MRRQGVKRTIKEIEVNRERGRGFSLAIFVGALI
jgi:hypothetical protein